MIGRRSAAAVFVAATLLTLIFGGCAAGAQGRTPLPAGGTAGEVPHDIQHVVVVVEENHSFSDIIGRPDAPYINSIAAGGALFTEAYGVEHPSQPNYLDLFSGSNQGITDDSCPHTFSAPNLAHSLLQAGLTFVGYGEELPSPGYTGCTYGTADGYWRKHNPWVDFSNVPTEVNQPWTAFPAQYADLPAVSFVIPNQGHDMHNGTIRQGDDWLRGNLGGYAAWAPSHHALLVITWDESEGSAGNHIPLIITGADVVAGTYSAVVNHYSLLRTLTDLFGLEPIGKSSTVGPIVGIWQGAPGN